MRRALSLLEGVAELRGRRAHRPPKDLREMARIRVADFERDFDEAAGGFPDQLLCLQHALADHELMRRLPMACLNTREKWNVLSSANSASVSMEMLSARCART